jgi:hypothetical protein
LFILLINFNKKKSSNKCFYFLIHPAVYSKKTLYYVNSSVWSRQNICLLFYFLQSFTIRIAVSMYLVSSLMNMDIQCMIERYNNTELLIKYRLTLICQSFNSFSLCTHTVFSSHISILDREFKKKINRQNAKTFKALNWIIV